MVRPLRASLVFALALGWAAFARAADDSPDPDVPDVETPTTAPAPASQPRTGSPVFKAQTTFQVMSIMSKSLSEQPCSPGCDKLKSFVVESVQKTAQLPPEQQDKATEAQLEQFNYIAASIDPQTTPPDTVRQINNGAAYLNSSAGHFEQAKDYSDREILYDPDDRDAYINRSMANYGLNRLDQAYQDADKAAKLDPKSVDAYRARAMASYAKKNYLDAIEDARRALVLDPNDRTSFAIMKLSESRVPAMSVDTLKSRMAMDILRDYHGMVQQLNQVQQKSQVPPSSPTLAAAQRLLRDAAGKITVKDYAGAIADANVAITVDPNNASAYYYRAAAENLLGRYEEAEGDSTRALLLTPSDAPLRDARAWALNHMGRFRDAIADSNHSLEVNPQNPYAFANRGYSYEQMGDLDTMLRDLKSAAALSPDFEPAYHDAAARHGLNPETADRGPTEAQLRAVMEQARRRSFLTVIISSIIGGLLIAAGFLHLSLSEKAHPARRGGTVTVADLNLGKLEAGYALGRQLGIGGMGVVFEAFDKALQRKVAIKVLRGELSGDPADRARFIEEARTVAGLRHPGIVEIHSIVEDGAGVYLIFEYIEGRNLHDVLAQRGRLPLAEAKMILKQVCKALDYAHHHDIVHRDLKPGNIMVSEQGLVKVMDFGISRHALDAAGPLSASERATACGTADYMAPEQEQGLVRKESDVYSLGCLLYEMLTGQRVFTGSVSLRTKQARAYTRPSVLISELSRDVDKLVDFALHPDPAERVRSARDFWALLEHIPENGSQA
jgi:tetratricopeptide (TPR) repeat protein